jgi:hypothetical protein
MAVEGVGAIGFVAFAIVLLAAHRFAAGLVFLAIALIPLGLAVGALVGLRRLRIGSATEASHDT